MNTYTIKEVSELEAVAVDVLATAAEVKRGGRGAGGGGGGGGGGGQAPRRIHEQRVRVGAALDGRPVPPASR